MATVRGTRKKRKKLLRKKICRLCDNRVTHVDFKDIELLRRYQTELGRILPRRITGACFRHQKMLSAAIKRARNVALAM